MTSQNINMLSPLERDTSGASSHFLSRSISLQLVHYVYSVYASENEPSIIFKFTAKGMFVHMEKLHKAHNIIKYVSKITKVSSCLASFPTQLSKFTSIFLLSIIRQKLKTIVWLIWVIKFIFNSKICVWMNTVASPVPTVQCLQLHF